MISKSRLTLLRALRQKKNRADHRLFVAEGDKLVLELLNSEMTVKSIYATENWLKNYSREGSKAAEVVKVTIDELSRISSLVTPQEVIAVVEIPEVKLDYISLLDNYCIVLDGIRDPGNLGAIIRIADWYGIQDIICSTDSADSWNPKVVQASMGSLIRVRLHEISPEEFILNLGNAAKETSKIVPPIYGTFLSGNSIYETAFSKSGCIVIGNEANGIRPETEKLISNRVTIPRWSNGDNHSGQAESLNAAIATAIMCAEVRRCMV